MKKRKVIAIIICLALLLMLSMEVLEAGHNCMGEGCEICAVVSVCHDVFTKVLLLSIVIEVLLLLCTLGKGIGHITEGVIVADNLITEKVKLSA